MPIKEFTIFMTSRLMDIKFKDITFTIYLLMLDCLLKL